MKDNRSEMIYGNSIFNGKCFNNGGFKNLREVFESIERSMYNVFWTT